MSVIYIERRTLSVVRDFHYEGGIYFHAIDLNTDNLYLVDFNYKPLLRYTSDLSISEIKEHSSDDLFDKNKSIGDTIGHIHLVEGVWVFRDAKTGNVFNKDFTIQQVEGVIDFEVEVSKLWLKQKFPLNAQEGE